MSAQTQTRPANDEQSVAPKPPAHIAGIDGLRGLAALVVVVYHLFTNSGNPELRVFGINIFRPLHDGWAGVNLFLVLSGFCLYWPFARSPERRQGYLEHLRRRSWRIFPAYYFSLLAVPAAYWAIRNAEIGVEGRALPRSATDVLLHLPLLHGFHADSFRSWNGVTWSLALEWTWYLVFPAAVLMFRRWGPLRAVGVMVAITVAYRVGLYLILGPADRFPADQIDKTFTLRCFLAGRLAEFAMGMFVAWWLAHRAISRRATWAASFAVPVLLAAAHATTGADAFLPVRDMLYGLAFASLLLVAVSPWSRVFRCACEHRLLRFTGECSYSFYLLHMPMVSLVAALLAGTGLKAPHAFGVSLLSIPVMVVFAWFAYRLVEAPFLKSGRPASAPALVLVPRTGTGKGTGAGAVGSTLPVVGGAARHG